MMRPASAGRIGWWPALLIGAISAAVALLIQNVLRDTWQIRTLPERVMEWLLLFVPLDVFERGLQQLGANAKEVALTGTVAGMGVLLLVVGALALRFGATGWRLLALAVGLWLIAMGVVMPLTGAGFFATGLLISPVLTSAGYLVVFLGYASVLLGGRLLIDWRAAADQPAVPDRRALLAGLIGTVAAYGLARYAGREGGLVASTLPLAVAPTPSVGSRQPTEAATSTAALQSPPATPEVAQPEPLPVPPPPRQLVRDKDGSLTAAGRPQGSLAPAITSNDDFYIVTKNAVADPVVDAATWRLIIDGEVNRPVQVDYRTLRALPAVEVTKTLECISNLTAACNLTSFGCDLISTARWKGVRLVDLIDLAGGLKPNAVGLAVVSSDEFSAGLPIEVAMDDQTLVVYEMNGQVLPREHGYPARLLVPGRYGMKNPKWLVEIRVTPREYLGWYEQRNWNKDGIVKTMSRIDVPADGAQLPAGQQRIAGIAYAGDRGIQKVEFSTDDGQTWRTARILEPPPGPDVMARWEGDFMLPAGATLSLVARATAGTGEVQTDEFSLPQPDGASGRHTIEVTGVA